VGGKKEKKIYIIESPRMADRQNCIGWGPIADFYRFMMFSWAKRLKIFRSKPQNGQQQTYGVY
jgi:hypothetical protein